jgi:hypothetical protein
MINDAWDEYRGWDARAIDLQDSSKKWNTAALISASAAAVFGAAATQASSQPTLGKVLSILAAAAAALTPVLGKEILSSGEEAKWIRARATAEAIKSECYRYLARASDYASGNVDDTFVARREALSADATQALLTIKASPVGPEGDKLRPPDTMDAAWYLANRIDDQIAYYSRQQAEHERAVKRLRYLNFGASAAAAVFGVAGVANQDLFAPWVGALMTIATAIAAYALLDRQQYLAASYGAMAVSLGRLRSRAATLALAELVTRAEDLMQGQHAAWTQRMTQTIAPPPRVPDKAGATDRP